MANRHENVFNHPSSQKMQISKMHLFIYHFCKNECGERTCLICHWRGDCIGSVTRKATLNDRSPDGLDEGLVSGPWLARQEPLHASVRTSKPLENQCSVISWLFTLWKLVTSCGHNSWAQPLGILGPRQGLGGGKETMLGADPATELATEGQSTIYGGAWQAQAWLGLALIPGHGISHLEKSQRPGRPTL